MNGSAGIPTPASSSRVQPASAGSAPRPERRSDPPVQATLVDLWEKVSKLMRQEIALAKAELSDKAELLKARLVSSAAGAALMLAGLLSLVAAVILLLATVMPSWLAALVTGACACGAGYLLIARVRGLAAELEPERTLQNVEKDIQTFTEASR